MSKPRVTYFDIVASRGEEVRLALDLAGVQFDDNRVARKDYASLKPDLPFPHLPIFEIDGHGVFAQTNAILRLIGRLHGLYPEDPYDAARHDAVMDAVEDLRFRVSLTALPDLAERRAARRRLAEDVIPHWGRGVDGQIASGPFVSGERPGVADIKLFMMDRFISSGGLDDVPPDVLDPFPKLKDVVRSLRRLPAAIARYGIAD